MKPEFFLSFINSRKEQQCITNYKWGNSCIIQDVVEKYKAELNLMLFTQKIIKHCNNKL